MASCAEMCTTSQRPRWRGGVHVVHEVHAPAGADADGVRRFNVGADERTEPVALALLPVALLDEVGVASASH
ncbi:hypothetical protein GCM10022226_61670 [Sphaerisporangium flaviroseum]|uniref:Uncharacterized protein n=1 Tax=Sphaerisporangium flaviroseum TaxID=509199 RepID=A0ABP7J1R4_9ACTN